MQKSLGKKERPLSNITPGSAPHLRKERNRERGGEKKTNLRESVCAWQADKKGKKDQFRSREIGVMAYCGRPRHFSLPPHSGAQTEGVIV